MGFFRYFIKCIIRNIAWRICKPRNLLIISIICVVLALFTSTCFASEATIVNPTETMEFDNISDRDAYQYDDQFGHLYTMQNSIQQKLIANLYANKENPGFEDFVFYLFHEVKNLGLSNKTLYIESSTTAPSATMGFVVYFAYVDHLQENVVSNVNFGFDQYYYKNVPVCTGQFTRVGYIHSENNITSAVINYTSISDKTVPFACLNVFNPSFIELFKYYGLITEETSSELEALNQKAEQTNNSLNIINSTMDKQNQLQQEQNNFLQQDTSDSDVSIDGFNSVDSNDITSAGLTGIFTNIYNSITNWSSKDISLPIPYTNKSILIPANYTENMLSSFGGNWIITFVNSIYYFIVARFIIYSITNIINSIKSGSILETDSRNNITTDML